MRQSAIEYVEYVGYMSAGVDLHFVVLLLASLFVLAMAGLVAGHHSRLCQVCCTDIAAGPHKSWCSY